MTGPSKRVAVYERVSSEDQDLAGQDRDLRNLVAAQGGEVVRVFAEKVTGTGKACREEYDRLMAEARDPGRAWDTLAVWAIDRFSREPRFDLAVGRILDLEKAGVHFISMKEPYLSTPDAKDPYSTFARNVLLGVLSNVASFEAQRRGERTRVAMRELKEGHRKTRSGNPVGRPVRATPEKVATILALRGRGLAWKAVAQRVGLPAGTCASVGSLARRGALKTLSTVKGPAPP